MTTNVLQITPRNEPPGVGLDGSRGQLAEVLWSVLADNIVLMHKTLGCHWNVSGPLFTSVHALTETHYENIFAAVDDLAERIRGLGYVAPYSIDQCRNATSLKAEFSDASAAAMIGELADDHTVIAKTLREAIDNAEIVGDKVTADLLTTRLAFHEESIWMLRALLAE